MRSTKLVTGKHEIFYCAGMQLVEEKEPLCFTFLLGLNNIHPQLKDIKGS